MDDDDGAPINQKVDITIPHASITSFNITSSSAYHTNNQSKGRYIKLVKIIKFLLSTSHVLCLQETKLGRFDKTYLKGELPNHTILYNNFRKGQAGTIIIISNSLHKTFHIIPIDLPPVTEGYVQAVRFEPKDGNNSLPFNIVNVYNDPAKMLNTFHPILKLHPGVHHFFAGDWNFSEVEGEGSKILEGKRKKIWEKITERFTLSEIPQPSPTHYFITKEMDECRTSRPDKIFISHSEAERIALRPKVFIPGAPYSIAKAYLKKVRAQSRNQGEGEGKQRGEGVEEKAGGEGRRGLEEEAGAARARVEGITQGEAWVSNHVPITLKISPPPDQQRREKKEKKQQNPGAGHRQNRRAGQGKV